MDSSSASTGIAAGTAVSDTGLSRITAGDSGLETGEAHAGSMSVGDGLKEHGVVCDLIPVDLIKGQRECQVRGKYQHTSLRLFCFRIAKRKRAIAFSLLGDMVLA